MEIFRHYVLLPGREFSSLHMSLSASALKHSRLVDSGYFAQNMHLKGIIIIRMMIMIRANARKKLLVMLVYKYQWHHD